MKKFDEINIIPFIDIMLVMLAIVLITASFIAQGKIQVSIPKSNSEIKLTADDLAKLLTINQQGEFFFNDTLITKEALDGEMATWNPDQKVTLKVDSNVRFQEFVSITDLFSKYKITNVAIVTMKDKNTGG